MRSLKKTNDEDRWPTAKALVELTELDEEAHPLYNSARSTNEDGFPAAKALVELTTLFLGKGASSKYENSPSSTSRRRSLRLTKNEDVSSTDGPLFILAFDEAHTLTKRQGAKKEWSYFYELRHALRALNASPCFSLFMSTTGKLGQFTAASEEDPSRRIFRGELILIQPFTVLGFDPLAEKISLKHNKLDLRYLTCDRYMVHLGRPL